MVTKLVEIFQLEGKPIIALIMCVHWKGQRGGSGDKVTGAISAEERGTEADHHRTASRKGIVT